MDYPFKKLFIDFLKNEQYLSSSTISDLSSDVARFFTFLKTNNTEYQKQLSIAAISTLDIKNYLSKLQIEKNIKNSTYNKILTHLNRYFIFLFEHELSNSLPTLSIKGIEKKKVKQHVIQPWTNKLTELLANQELSFYTRITLLLIAHYYTIKEIINPSFYQVLTDETWNESELIFLHQFEEFHQQFAKKQHSKAIYLKQKINIANPILSLPGLHKILKKDQAKVQFELKPSKLYQDAVLTYITNHQNYSDKKLCQNLHLTTESLNYYRSML